MHANFSKRKTPYSKDAHPDRFFKTKNGKDVFSVQKTLYMSNGRRTNFLQKRETLLRMKQIRKTLFLENNATVAESSCMPISLNERRRTTRTLIQIDFSKPKTAKTFFPYKKLSKCRMA